MNNNNNNERNKGNGAKANNPSPAEPFQATPESCPSKVLAVSHSSASYLSHCLANAHRVSTSLRAIDVQFQMHTVAWNLGTRLLVYESGELLEVRTLHTFLWEATVSRDVRGHAHVAARSRNLCGGEGLSGKRVAVSFALKELRPATQVVFAESEPSLWFTAAKVDKLLPTCSCLRSQLVVWRRRWYRGVSHTAEASRFVAWKAC